MAFDTVNSIIAYENGDMDECEVIEFFQHLVDTGLAWQLQGSYGRTASALIHAGKVHFAKSSTFPTGRTR